MKKVKISIEIENKPLEVESLADAMNEIELYDKVKSCPLEDLPLYIGMGYDKLIAKRLERKSEDFRGMDS